MQLGGGEPVKSGVVTDVTHVLEVNSPPMLPQARAPGNMAHALPLSRVMPRVYKARVRVYTVLTLH